MTELSSALRTLRRRPAVAAGTVAIFALAIGANTALFSLLHTAVIRPLPFPEPERLVAVNAVEQRTGRVDEVSAADYQDWRAAAGDHFAGLAPWALWSKAVTGLGEPEELSLVRAGADLFPVLGAAPALGTVFTAEHEVPGRDRVAVVSHGFWVERLGGDAGAIGRTLTLDGEPYTVIWVMPSGFRFPDRDGVRLWIPLAFNPVERTHRAQRMFDLVGRLAPGVSPGEAEAALAAVAARLGTEYPASNAGWSARVTSARTALAPRHDALLLLMGAVVLVLLIGCANVANLLLADGIARERELAVRLALGATRIRLARQLLLESLVLGLLGGAAGLGLGVWLREGLLAMAPDLIPHWQDGGLNLAVIGFTLAVTLVAAGFAGLAPVRRLWRADPERVLRQESSRGTGGPRAARLRSWLVAGEVALAFPLAVGAALLAVTLVRLDDVDPGFAPDQLYVTTINLADSRYPGDTRQHTFFAALRERVLAAPGVTEAGLVTTLPMHPDGIDHDLSVTVEGDPPPSGPAPEYDFRIAGPGYLAALQVPLVRGRDFRPADDGAAPRVMVINQTMARRVFGGRDPLGRRVTIPGGSYQIIGVVGDVRHRGLDAEPRAEMFVPIAQYYSYGYMNLVVRAGGDLNQVAVALRAAVRDLDADQPLGTVRAVPELIRSSVAPRRFSLLLLAGLAAAGIGLAAVGVYGVVALTVRQRRRELGIRLALGARPAAVALLVLGQGLRPALAGLAAGVAAAVALTGALRHLLYGVTPLDPAAFAAAALALLLAAVLAMLQPARRAAAVDPVAALRAE